MYSRLCDSWVRVRVRTIGPWNIGPCSHSGLILLTFNDFFFFTYNWLNVKLDKLSQTNLSNVFVSNVGLSSWLDLWDNKPSVQNCYNHFHSSSSSSSSEMRIHSPFP